MNDPALDSLEKLASRYQTPAETLLLRKAPLGLTAFCGAVEDEDDPSATPLEANDPANSAGWNRDREVSAELIRRLCVEPTVAARIDPRGIKLCAAKITGKLDLSYVTVAFPLSFDRCVFDHDADFSYLKTPGLAFTGCRMKSVNADGANVGGDLSFDDGFESDGGVRMLTAQIGANLECNGGTFRNRDGHALYADRVKITGSAFLGRRSKRFQAEGTVRLIGAQIGSVLSCTGGSFHKPEPKGQDAVFALICDRMKASNVFFNDGFSAEGEVRLWGADIGLDLTCKGGSFSNPTGNALSAEGAKMAGNVSLNEEFVAQGVVDLLDCQIGGHINCHGGTFSKLSLVRATIKGSFRWSEVRNRQQVVLDLTNASAGPLEDAEDSWPERGNLTLDGFGYSRIGPPAPSDVKSRLRWLALAPQFTLQPYQQLAKVLKDSGDTDAPPLVLCEMEHRYRHNRDRSWLQRSKSWILHWTIGYGERPLWALGWLLLLIAFGSVFFGLGYLGGVMIPNDKDAYAAFEQKGYAPNNYPAFNPLIYSVENSFSPISLGIRAQWQPGPRCSGAAPPVLHYGVLQCLHDNGVKVNSLVFLRGWMWAQTMAGWALATLFAAGITGLVKST